MSKYRQYTVNVINEKRTTHRRAKGVELKQEKKPKNINIEEFRALVKNLIPTTLKQMDWVCSEVERLTYEHPELKEKIKEWHMMPEFEGPGLEESIHRILAEIEKSHQKR
jgi:hypothetical protein